MADLNYSLLECTNAIWILIQFEKLLYRLGYCQRLANAQSRWLPTASTHQTIPLLFCPSNFLDIDCLNNYLNV